MQLKERTLNLAKESYMLILQEYFMLKFILPLIDYIFLFLNVWVNQLYDWIKLYIKMKHKYNQIHTVVVFESWKDVFLFPFPKLKWTLVIIMAEKGIFKIKNLYSEC